MIYPSLRRREQKILEILVGRSRTFYATNLCSSFRFSFFPFCCLEEYLPRTQGQIMNAWVQIFTKKFRMFSKTLILIPGITTRSCDVANIEKSSLIWLTFGKYKIYVIRSCFLPSSTYFVSLIRKDMICFLLLNQPLVLFHRQKCLSGNRC